MPPVYCQALQYQLRDSHCQVLTIKIEANTASEFLSGKSSALLRQRDHTVKTQGLRYFLTGHKCSAGKRFGSGTKLSRLLVYYGARGRNRTGTVLPPRDFKSLASTSFATRADFAGIVQKQCWKTNGRIWRLSPESNRGPRLCRPLHNHSATQPMIVAKPVFKTPPVFNSEVLSSGQKNLERETRFELATPTLARLCSTS